MENDTIDQEKKQEICNGEEIRKISFKDVEIEVNLKADLLEMGISCGFQIMEVMFKQDVDALCGPHYSHSEDQGNKRWGKTDGEIVLGGRKIKIKRPRVRNEEKGEIPIPTYEHLKKEDPLNERVLTQILVGVTTRKYEDSLETKVLDDEVTSRGASKSAVSRRFVAMTTKRLIEWMSRPLEGLELVVLFIDGVELGGHTLIVALGVDKDGKKHILSAWEGATENLHVAQGLIDNLIERGLDINPSTLFVIDGSKALRKAIKQTFGEGVCIQRCQRHKIENVKGYLPKELHTSVELTMRQAYQSDNVSTAKRILTNLAQRLKMDHPGASSSLMEGLDETLTVISLGLPKVLRQSLQTTNVIESALSYAENIARNVKRWKNGIMALRWMAQGFMEAEKRFRRIRGYRELPLLIKALKENKGLSKENVA